MEERKANPGWTEKGIVGLIFAPLGLTFLPLGLILGFSRAVEAEDRPIFLAVFCGIGGAFLLTALLLLGLEMRRRRRQQAAFERGICVQAEIAGLRTNDRVNMRGTHPAQLECRWTDPDTGVVHVYFSRYLYVNVSGLVEGAAVPLYLDRDDPSVGYVDVDAVLPEIRVHRA